MAKEKLTQSEIDGVEYRRAKLWQIILIAFNAFNGMAMYFLIGLECMPKRPQPPRFVSAVTIIIT